tara:strand:- start:1853 stop:3037 length:1185 start_codon:yes stop_codon:yes gene_type:complete
MKKITYIFFALFIFIALAHGASSRAFIFSNYLRFGYDDNLYQSHDDKTETAYISDLFNISGNMKFSNGDELLLYWQPELRYRFDAEEKMLFLQDLYLNYTKLISNSSEFQITDRLRYSEIDANQSNVNSGKEYSENNLKGSFRKKLDKRNGINISGGIVNRRNDLDSKAFDETRDFDRYNITTLFSRDLDPDKRTVSLGYYFSDHKVHNNAGGMNSTTLFLGYDRVFNPEFIGSIQFGYTDAEIEQKDNNAISTIKSSSSSPFFEMGFNYKLSGRTELSSSFSRSLRYSTSTYYNAEERDDWLIAVNHDITSKINLGISYSIVSSNYDSDYLRDISANYGSKDLVKILNIRADYQINRNHFFEVGYQGRSRNTEISNNSDYDKNRIYLGWKLQL